MQKGLFLFLSILLLSCNNHKKETSIKLKKDNSIIIIAKTKPSGKKLLNTKCGLCHNNSADFNNRIAPPFIAIKAHYINEKTTKKEFVNNFISFLENPTKQKAKLHGAVKRFGLMPYQKFNNDELKIIAEYLYDYEIEEPKWFKKHWQEHGKKPYINTGKKNITNNNTKTPKDIGLKYALETKKVLGKNLMSKIQKEGTLNALQFCNENAYDLTHKMAKKFNATIKRVSDKPRNSNNIANINELKIIDGYKKLQLENKKTPSITKTTNGKTQFYHPIKTNTMCLQCHGKTQENIKPNVLKKILKLYPNDKATGYIENQIRGIWSITFNN